MAISKKKTEEKKQTKLGLFDEVTVIRAHDFGGGAVAFDATFDNLVTVYGMRYLEGQKKDGTEYSFISFPQIKGKDGNYYNRCYLMLTDELKQQIMDQLEEMI